MYERIKIGMANLCVLSVAAVAFATAMLNFAGCEDGSRPKECSGDVRTVACEKFFCDRLRTDRVADHEDARKEQAMRLSFSKTENGAWQCDQNRRPLVSAEFISFVWRKYAEFAHSQTDRSGKNLHFILSFPSSMPCGLHHYTLSAFEVMGVPIAYAEYPVGVVTNYTIVSSQSANPGFPDSRAFMEKSTEVLHQIAISKGILIRTFRQSVSDNETYLQELGLPHPATNVQDFIEILTKDKDERVLTINAFSGIITYESPVACKPHGISEVDAALRQPLPLEIFTE